ncbi:MAG: hypothetical protein ACO31I_18490, partial [Prochlorotrichaceae cyanobacterium]
RIIASEGLSDDDRAFYVGYRRQLLDYSDRRVRFESMPNCEAILEAIEEISTPASPPAIENSTFNWEQEIAQIRNRSQPVNSPPVTSTSPSSSTNVTGVESGNSASTPTEVELQEEQGIFFRPAPTSNIPAASIRGSVMSYLPIEAEDIVVHYDIYSFSKSDGPNNSNVYTCSATERYRRVADKLVTNAQASVFIEERDRFVQIVGITWSEQGNRAFVRVSEFQTTSNVRPCSAWYPYYYYNYFDRQAVDPRIRLR